MNRSLLALPAILVVASGAPAAAQERGPGTWGFGSSACRGQAPSNCPSDMRAARERVFQAARDNGIYMLHTCSEDDVVARLEEGVMICTGGYEAGRAHTDRQMPW